MAWSRTRTLHQSFSIEVDIESFIDKLCELMAEDITEVDDVELELDDIDDSVICFAGNYTCDCKTWYEPQTMWEPAEYEIEREFLEAPETDRNLKKCLVKHAEELINALNVHVDEHEENAWIDEDD